MSAYVLMPVAQEDLVGIRDYYLEEAGHRALRANMSETDPVCLIKEQGGKENPHESADNEWSSFGLGGRGT